MTIVIAIRRMYENAAKNYRNFEKKFFVSRKRLLRISLSGMARPLRILENDRNKHRDSSFRETGESEF